MIVNAEISGKQMKPEFLKSEKWKFFMKRLEIECGRRLSQSSFSALSVFIHFVTDFVSNLCSPCGFVSAVVVDCVLRLSV